MFRAIKNNMFVNLIGQQVGRRITDNIGQGVEIFLSQDGTRRIVWKIQDNQSGTVVDAVSEALPVDLEIGTELLLMSGTWRVRPPASVTAGS